MTWRLAKPTAPVTLAVGGGAYLLLAVLADRWVVGAPEANRILQTVILMLLGLAFVAAAEGFLAVIRAIPRAEMLGWPFRAAAVGSVAYTMVYGNRVFVNYWNYDDWVHFAALELPLDKAYILLPLNDHFVPFLRIVLWCTSRIFGFDYIGAACLQQTAFLLIVLALGHLLWGATRRPWLLTLLVSLFAMWPSYGSARTWFSGGFWLTASAALLSVYVLHSRRMISGEAMRLPDIGVSSVLAAMTVFISSQTLMPAIYLAAFCAPVVLWSGNRGTGSRRLGLLCGISLVPSALALLGRSVYVVHAPFDTSGLFNGRLLANLGVFIVNKGLLIDADIWFIGRRPICAVSGFFFLLLLVAAKTLAARRTAGSGRRAGLLGLILGGSTLFIVSIAQIGMGRRWDYDAVVNRYYATLPFLGLWLAGAGAGLYLLWAEDGAAARRAWKTVFSAVVMGAAVVVCVVGISVSEGNLAPLEKRLQLIHAQRKFEDDLGAAVCDLARLHRDGPSVRWQPSLPLTACRMCQDIIGPPAFLRAFAASPVIYHSLARSAARRRCPTADLTPVFPAGPAPLTDGSESEAARSFTRTYLGLSLPDANR